MRQLQIALVWDILVAKMNLDIRRNRRGHLVRRAQIKQDPVILKGYSLTARFFIAAERLTPILQEFRNLRRNSNSRIVDEITQNRKK